MTSDGLVEALLGELAPSDVVTDPQLTESYRADHAQGMPSGRPLVVIFPRSAAQVSAALKIAAEARLPVVPRGAGSGLSGGANAIDGCIMVVMERMDAILSIDPHDGIAVVQPGVLNTTLRNAVRPYGLWYAPDPASSDFCSIGGNVATNAGGLCCVKYGVTRQSVLGLQVVLPDGSVTRVGQRSLKGVAGYDLTGLFVGSEGTLGIVTEITVRLRPLPPPAATVVALMPSLAAAAEAVQATLITTTPSLLELIDRTTIRAIEDWKGLGLDTSSAALLLSQTDLPGTAAEVESRQLQKIFSDCGATEVFPSETPEEADLMLGARRFAFPALERLGRVFLEDVAVPRGRLAELLAAVELIAAESGLLIGTFGHAGDGNMHPTVVTPHDEPPGAGAAAFESIMQAALDLGGTITGEHGIGLLKRDGLGRELDDAARRVHLAIKQAIDPLGLLNPGKGLATAP